ncbi:hypothetical protein ANN_27128 [Periplaneta americana]|uniref:Reverse transcriptase domain-containing protein n=1 Tax=Periplaneta americana TaxID=6978 RepID=A0ABQ8RX84_PERAM|nr:hypothetical protein ANN_27128 [Periplaneta americana]
MKFRAAAPCQSAGRLACFPFPPPRGARLVSRDPTFCEKSDRFPRQLFHYKGKGNTDNPNSDRGIALENNIFKIFMKVLTAELEKKTKNQTPDCQFGFRRNKSTLQAVKLFIDEIEQALRGIT